MPKTLHLTLTYHWWDKIASCEKNAEYRRFTANWRKRLADVRPGDLVVFHRGYTSRTITPPDRANPRDWRLGLAQRGVSILRRS